MDNLNKIKFKQSIPGWLFKIDGSGKTEFKEGKKFVAELQAWKDLGNEIEPQFTPEELKEKEAKEAANALENQEQTLLNLIKNNEYHLISRRFTADIEAWKTKLDKWDAQLKEVKARKLVEIEPVPVFD